MNTGIEKNKEINLIKQGEQKEELLEVTSSSPFLIVLEGALKNIKPGIEMKRRRIGSSKQRIPKEIDDNRSTKIALRWLVEGAKERGEAERKKPYPKMFENLAEEIIDAYTNNENNPSKAFKKKETLYKEAESGRVFSSNR